MQKNFDEWNEEKKKVAVEKPRFYSVREIWWCKFGKNIGYEQNGKGKNFTRPCIILYPFSPHTCLVAPLTTSLKQHFYRVAIGLVEGKEARADLSQMRVIDTRRFLKKVGFLNKAKFTNLKKRIQIII